MAKKRSKPKVIKPTVEGPLANHETSAAVPVSVSLNVCRLCETQDGPFLNIFDAEKNTAKIIENLMPFDITENDDLPQKICFRCSAKVEEFNEFVQKCIKTLENFYTALGKKRPMINKVKTHRLLWEEKLNKSNTTNEVICDAVIKKAMEGIALKFPIKEQQIPIKDPVNSNKKDSFVTDTAVKTYSKNLNSGKTPGCDKTPSGGKATGGGKVASAGKIPSDVKSGDDKTNNLIQAGANQEKPAEKNKKRTSEDIPRKNTGKSEASDDEKVERRKLRSTRSTHNETVNDKPPETLPVSTSPEKSTKNKQNLSQEPSPANNPSKEPSRKLNNLQSSEQQLKKAEKPFNIMDHVCMIKVNGVGVLFQCQLCNRNFLKKEVVLTHFCAKNGAAKEDYTKKIQYPPVEAPRVPNVKYINTKTNLDITNQSQTQNKPIEHKVDSVAVKSTEEKQFNDVKTTPVVDKKSKPRIGPASRVKRVNDDSEIESTVATSKETSSTSKNVAAHSVVQCPSAPSLGCQYTLLPGPNNTYTLVEAQSSTKDEEQVSKKNRPKKRKTDPNEHTTIDNNKNKQQNLVSSTEIVKQTWPNPAENTKVIAGSSNPPYPVGLIQSVPRKPSTPGIIPFSASPKRKQSYAVVPTDNPSKILILAKPGQSKSDAPKKRQQVVKDHDVDNSQPYNVTMEDTTHPQDPGFFTFINVDPLLQPSYVLPTDNVLHETPVAIPAHKARNAQKPYSCNMCNLKFITEKQLLVHIHAHYNEEDETAAVKTVRRRKH